MPIDLPPRPEPGLKDILAAMLQRIEAKRGAPTPEVTVRPALSPVMPIPASIDREQLVAIWPVLSRLAIAAGLGPELRLWVIAHYISRCHGGRGFVTVREIIDVTGWTAQTIRRLVEQSRGIFVRDTIGSGADRRVYIVSQTRAAQCVRALAIGAGVYDAGEPERLRWQVSVDELTGSLAGFYACCFAGWIGTHKGFEYRVSWDVLKKAWGRSRQQITDWMDQAGLRKHHNYGCFEIPDWLYMSDLVDQFTVPFTIDEYDGKRFAYYRRANNYKATDRWRKVSASGKRYKIDRAIDRAGVSGGMFTIICGHSTGHDGNIAASAGQQSRSLDAYTRHNFTRIAAYNQATRHRCGYLYLLSGISRRSGVWSYTAPG